MSYWRGSYSREDGSKVMEMICPDRCEHGWHDLAYEPITSFWSIFVSYVKCRRCGKRFTE